MSSVERDRSLPEVGTRQLLDFLRAYRASGAFNSGPAVAPLPPASMSSAAAESEAVEAVDRVRARGSRRLRRNLPRLFARRS